MVQREVLYAPIKTDPNYKACVRGKEVTCKKSVGQLDGLN